MPLIFRKFLVLVIMVGPFFKIEAVSWALLPVKFNGYAHNHLANGPQFNPDDPDSGWQMAQLIRLYLGSNFVNTVLPMEAVKRSYKKNNLGLNADLTEYRLKDIAREIDTDKILLTEVFFSKSLVRIETRIFNTRSQTISDTLTISGEKFFETLGQSLQQRFQFIGNNFITKDERYYYVFGLDASGKNYNEIHYLPNLISELDIDRSAGASVDGYGKNFILKPTEEKSTLLDYINHVKPQSTDTTDTLYAHMLESVIEMLDKAKNPDEKKISVLIVSSAPKKITARQKVNGFIRRVAHKSSLLILGNGKLSPDERNYWELMSTSNTKVHYKDILYKQKIGLSDGNSIYLMKSGNKLLESNIGDVQYSHEIFLNTDELRNYNQDTIVKTFETATQKTIVSPGKPEISYNISLLSDIIKTSNRESREIKARVLLLIENKPFWIELPYKSIQDNEGKLILNNGEKYYFLLNLTTANRGMPFKNSPSFGEVIPPSQVPKILMLNMEKFLKNQELYLGKSIAGTSLYVIYGTVKDVQVEQKRIY